MSTYWIWRFHGRILTQVLLCQTNNKLESSEIKKKSEKNNVYVETVGIRGTFSKSKHRNKTFEKFTHYLETCY